MSEYQYFEFLAADRPLTDEQMKELRGYSGRAEITPTRFVNVYNWGEFKGDPDEWIERYFDAFVYVANWGTRRLIFRVPRKFADPSLVQQYAAAESMLVRTKGDHLIVSFRSEYEEGHWERGEGWLQSLIGLRYELMQGDLRGLYLGWLTAVLSGEIDEEASEPPVPPGLGQLTGSQESLAEFLLIDKDLITAATEQSGDRVGHEPSKRQIAKWIRELPQKEKDAALVRLVTDDDLHLALELRRRLMQTAGQPFTTGTGLENPPRRNVGELLDRTEFLAEERRQREADEEAREKARQARAAEARRKKHLESLVGAEEELWARVDRLIVTKQPKRYDEAVSLLVDLRDLAKMSETTPRFTRRMNAVSARNTRKPSLMQRFRHAGLL